MKNNIINSKRAQHETLGFVLIIMIVVIVAVIFLSIAIRKNSPNIATDAELANFLSASSEYTTECYFNSAPPYRKIKELENDCYTKNFEPVKCPNGKNACDFLNITYTDMLKNFRPGGRVLSYYKLSFYFMLNGNESDVQKTPFGSSIVFGNLSGCTSRRGATNEVPIPEGKVISNIEVCEQS